MPVVQPNTKDMEELGPTPPGTYPATIKSLENRNSAKGNPMIVPKFEIRAKNEDGQPAVKTRSAYLVIEGKGTAGFDALLRACHLDALADRYRAGESVPFDTDKLVGQEVLVVLDNEMYQPTDEHGNKTGPAESRDRLKTFLKK